jgi:hypothetical protein
VRTCFTLTRAVGSAVERTAQLDFMTAGAETKLFRVYCDGHEATIEMFCNARMENWKQLYNRALTVQTTGDYQGAIDLFENARDASTKDSSTSFWAICMILDYAVGLCFWAQAGLEQRGQVNSLSEGTKQHARRATVLWLSAARTFDRYGNEFYGWPLQVTPSDLHAAANNAAFRGQLAVSAFEGGWRVDDDVINGCGALLHLTPIFVREAARQGSGVTRHQAIEAVKRIRPWWRFW